MGGRRAEKKRKKKKKIGGVKREEERMSRSTNCQLFLLVAHANAFLSSIPHACVLCVRINLNTNERTMKKNGWGMGVWRCSVGRREKAGHRLREATRSEEKGDERSDKEKNGERAKDSARVGKREEKKKI